MAGGLSAAGFAHAPLTPRSVHLCIDMQRLFDRGGVWETPWMTRVLPAVEEVACRFPDRTVFTRFIPPANAAACSGTWRALYEAWPMATRERLEPEALDLVPALARYAPPAPVIDRSVYSAFGTPALAAALAARGADGVIVSGAETDVCVLATVMAAVDLGFPVLILKDAVCSSSDPGHDALMTMFQSRLRHQIATATVEECLRAWPK